MRLANCIAWRPIARFAGVSEDRQILSLSKITQKEVGEKKNFVFLPVSPKKDDTRHFIKMSKNDYDGKRAFHYHEGGKL